VMPNIVYSALSNQSGNWTALIVYALLRQ